LIQLTSLQLLAFMMITCDVLLLVNDWAIDNALIKLICTAKMLAFNDSPMKCKLVFVFAQQTQKMNDRCVEYIQSIFGDDGYVYELDANEASEPQFVNDILRLIAKQKSSQTPISEQNWLTSAARYWESFVHKKSTFAKYVDFWREVSQLSSEPVQN
jgi:hypothetical protein